MGTVTWDVDDRPASVPARLSLWWMRVHRDQRAFSGARRTLDVARDRQRKGDHPPTLRTRISLRTASWEVAGMRVWRVRPRRRPTARVLYLHGGGYVHPLTRDYWRLVRALAAAPAEVIVPTYPLAPDATIDDVLPRLVGIVQWVRGRDDVPLVVMGDSAGGALALVLAQQLRDLGEPGPERVVALCPWLDATLDEAQVADLEPTDPMLAESGLRAAGRWWAGARPPTDPRVSPIHGVLSGLPPIDVVIGDRDILRPAVDRLAEVAERDRAALHVLEVTAMFHVWMTRLIPEATRTRAYLVDLLRSAA